MPSQKWSVVVGGAGFVGSHLIQELLRSGRSVRCFDRADAQVSLANSASSGKLEVMRGDLSDPKTVQAALVNCDVCYHLASSTVPKSSNEDPAHDAQTNILDTLHLLDGACKAGVKKVVFMSSGGTVYGIPEALPTTELHKTEPICAYGISKLAIEKYLALYHRLHGLEYAVLRVSNAYGPGQRMDSGQGAVAAFLGKALRGETLEIWGDGSNVRDYIYIDDVISALLAATQYEGAERIFNIGTGTGISLNQVLDAIEHLLGNPTTRRYSEQRVHDVPSNILSIEKAKHALGWTPRVRFEDGLKGVLESLRQE